jgi:cation diffusion facilitator CzcD-associated flavoprotein CzcO
MPNSNLKTDCEVAVIGAGPYGLGVAAHLKAAKIETRVFGEAMSFWQRHMPKQMMLRSSLGASDLSDADNARSLRAYADLHGIKLTYPVPIDTFIEYGKWFQAHAVDDLDTRRVERVETDGDTFRLHLADSDCVTAQRVVIAMGLANQEFKPAAFAGLAKDLVSHACDHADLAPFRGKRVAVIGRGQSACESAAILNDAGAEVELISRGPLHWLGSESASVNQSKDLIWYAHKMMSSKSGVGPFPLNQVAEFPDIVRMFPKAMREAFNKRCLRPGSTGWVRPRFEGVTVRAGRTILDAQAAGGRVSVRLDQGSSVVDHVLLATGYHIDCAKLGLFAPSLLNRIKQDDDAPVLTTGFESSVRGLHFVGASAVKSYGPLMRFVAGSGYAARHLTKALLAKRPLFQSVENWDAMEPRVAKRAEAAMS